MSTLRVDTLQTTDSSVTIELESLLAAVTIIPTASSSNVYLPPSNITVSSTTTINSDLVFSRGSTITVSVGATLTINGKITAPMSKIFLGAGLVVLGEKVAVALPEWFGAKDGSSTDGAATRRCIDACRANKVTTLFSSTYFAESGTDLRIFPDSPIASLPAAQFVGIGATNGFTLEPGNYLGYQFSLPRMAQFPGFAVKLRGANLAVVSLPSIQAGGDGIVYQAQSADANTVLDNKVSCHVISQLTANSVLVTADANGNILQGNETYINFSTSCLRGVLFQAPGGVTPNWDGFKFVFQAIDPTTGVSGAVGLGSVATNAVPKCTFRVETWFGGFPANGNWVVGEFNGLDFYANYNESFASYSAWQLEGVGNRVVSAFRGFDKQNAPIALASAANSRASWNGGAPVNYNDVYLQATLTGNVLAGGLVDFYFYHPYANTQKFSTSPVNMNGFAIQTLETSANTNEVRIQLLNVSGATKTTGQLITFFSSVG